MKSRQEKKLNITYGFEIEGIFSNSLIWKLRKADNKGFLTDYQEKYDGSVRFNNLERDSIAHVADPTELALGIFNSREQLMKFLRMFKNEQNYLHNATCGLHLHVFIGNNFYRSLFNEPKFMRKMHRFFCTKTCDCIKARVRNQYCRNYPREFTEYMHHWRGQSKYRFVRNHPSGTFEFRIFSACKHKEKNVADFLNFFYREIKKVEKQKTIIIDLPNEKYVRNTINL